MACSCSNRLRTRWAEAVEARTAPGLPGTAHLIRTRTALAHREKCTGKSANPCMQNAAQRDANVPRWLAEGRGQRIDLAAKAVRQTGHRTTPPRPPLCSTRAARGVRRAALHCLGSPGFASCRFPLLLTKTPTVVCLQRASDWLAHWRARPMYRPIRVSTRQHREGTAARSARLVKSACAIARLAQLGPVEAQTGVTLLSQLRVLRAATRTAASSRPTHPRQRETTTESAGSAAAHALLLSRAQGTPLLVPRDFLCLRQHSLRRPLLPVPNNSIPYTHTVNVKGDR